MNIFHELGVRSGKDRINEEIVYNIARAYTIIDTRAGAFLSPYKLSPAKFNILLMVQHAGKSKGIPQNEISKLLLVTTSNITHMIDKLEKDGYVERLAQKGDRRINLVRITKDGTELLDKIWPHYIKMIDNLIGSSFSRNEKKKINALLEKVKDVIKEG